MNQEKNLPRVLVGCPTADYKAYCLPAYVDAVKKLSYPCYDILLVDNSKGSSYAQQIKNLGIPVLKGPWFEGALQRIIHSRNLLREYALAHNYDYFFSLEQDVIPPKNILEKLLAHKKKVISAVYFTHNLIDGKQQLIPLAYKLLDKKNLSMRPLNDEELWKHPGLMHIVSAGLGAVLIHRDILEKVKFRFERDVFDDRFFFKDLYALKQEVWCDSSIKCKHLITRPIPWSQIKK